MEHIIKTCIHIPGINNAAGIPVLIEGSPGCGKTAIMNMIADAEELPLETVILSIREPQDVTGIPIVTKEGVKIEPPLWCKRLIKAGKGILFFDELACAPPSVQAAALRIVAERVVGDVVLPRDVRIVAATNSTEEAAGGWEIAPPLANRFMHYYWAGPNSESWGNWLLGSSPKTKKAKMLSQDDWLNCFAKAKGIISSFINHRPNLLGPNVPDDPVQAARAWPSPRTWEMATRAFAWCQGTGVSFHAFIRGIVGEGAAQEFASFEFYKDLPDPQDLINGKAQFIPDARLDKTLAVLSGLAAYAISYPDLSPKAWSLLKDISVKSKARDAMVPAAKALIRAELFHSPEATDALGEISDLVKNISAVI